MTTIMKVISFLATKFGLFVLLVVHLIHITCSIVYTKLYKSLNELLHYFSASRPKYSACSLNEEVIYYSKTPKHLALIIQEEDISYNDCIKLVLWCIQSQIPYLSFYTVDNAMNPTSLYEVLCKVNKRTLQSIKWGNTFHKGIREMAKKDINGYTWTPLVEVNMFSTKSTNDSIENIMLKLCQEGTKVKDISIERIDIAFREEIPLPDPCLAIIFGKSFSTVGYMPWQLRITELAQLPSHHNLRVEDFTNSLTRYASCEQRFGK